MRPDAAGLDAATSGNSETPFASLQNKHSLHFKPSRKLIYLPLSPNSFCILNRVGYGSLHCDQQIFSINVVGSVCGGAL